MTYSALLQEYYCNELARVYEYNCPLVHSLGTDPSCAIGLHCSRKEKDPEKKSETRGATTKPQQHQEALSSHRCDKGGNSAGVHQNRPVV